MYNCSVAGVQFTPMALFTQMRRWCSTSNGQGVQLRRYIHGFGMSVDDMIDIVQNPNAEDMFASICKNYDIDGRTIPEEERAVMMKILNRSKRIKAARKGRMPEKLKIKQSN